MKPCRAGGRPRVYTEEVRQAVEQLWELFGYLCGKRLVPVIRSSLPFLDEEEFLQVPGPVTEALGCISPATVDRLLRGAVVDKALLHLYHLPFPGLGRIADNDGVLGWVPIELD